jgi:hypothetical protein
VFFCKKTQRFLGKSLRACNILVGEEEKKMGEKWR